MKKTLLAVGLIILAAVSNSGCFSAAGHDTGMTVYQVITPEPAWIRNGEPIEFEGELWYPRDTVDILMDSEVIPLGEYRDVPFYLQTVDVRPYERIYTKFDNNKFRVFETKAPDDKSKKAF